MASLFNTRISDTYVGLIKSLDNSAISATLKQLSDGSGNSLGIYVNTSGDFKVNGILEWGSLKDTGEDITITKFVDEADGIGNNDNDTTIPTSAAVKDYVDTQITAEDLDFAGDSGSGSVDLDSQTFSIIGTTNEIETSATGQQLQIGLPSTISVNVTGNVTGNLTGDVTGDVTGDLTGNITATSVLADGVTATTQAQEDNSTKIATTAYVDAGLANQNTLGEILGEGNTTDGTDIKVTGGADITFNDNLKAKFGTGRDLEIYHDGSNSYIQDVGTGDLILEQTVDDQDIVFKSDDGSGGTTEYFKLDGSEVKTIFSKGTRHSDSIRAEFGSSGDLDIYHDGTDSYIDNNGGDLYIMQQANDKDISFQSDDGAGGTTEYFRVDGATEEIVYSKDVRLTDNIKLELGSSSDLQIYHDGSNSYIVDTGTGDLNIQADTNINIKKAGGGETKAVFTSDGGVDLYYDNSKKLETTSAGVSITGSATVSSDLILSDYGSGTHTGTATQRLGVDSSGNVIEIPIGAGAVDGSGTANTVTKWSDTDTITDSIITDNGSVVTFSTFGDISTNGFKLTGSSTYYRINNGGNSGLWNEGNYALQFGTNNVERMRLDSSGNLALGTTSPVEQFTVGGTGTQGRIGLNTTGVDHPYIQMTQFGSPNTNVTVRIDAGGDSYFNGGNVGIGTDSPSVQLDIEDTSNVLIDLNTTTADRDWETLVFGEPNCVI